MEPRPGQSGRPLFRLGVAVLVVAAIILAGCGDADTETTGVVKTTAGSAAAGRMTPQAFASAANAACRGIAAGARGPDGLREAMTMRETIVAVAHLPAPQPLEKRLDRFLDDLQQLADLHQATVSQQGSSARAGRAAIATADRRMATDAARVGLTACAVALYSAEGTVKLPERPTG